jgi:hypothetical protein
MTALDMGLPRGAPSWVDREAVARGPEKVKTISVVFSASLWLRQWVAMCAGVQYVDAHRQPRLYN